MTPEQFNRAMTLFDQLVDVAPAERGAALLAACPDDSLVRREVESLLNHDGGPSPLDGLPNVPPDIDVTLDRPQPHGLPVNWGGLIANYRVIGLLGEGGMGTVYEAEQASPRRRVALKVMRPGLASRETLRRFELEKEALGRLEHPCIARIYEAGTADAGQGQQPYFAMELVGGRTLVEYANKSQLDIRARVELLAKVCDAVHHAHQKSVVHRDLKPANILVNGEGDPKILDFGVARLVDLQTGEVTTATQTGHILGTLQYMSPEQAAGDVRSIDTRADVYALGLIAYELLGGRRPYNLDSKSLPHALRVIQEEEPSRLGTLGRSLRGDLETIVGKAMEKERERRYASVAELSADLRRFLSYEPIAARPPGTWYNLQKFARRNRALVGGVAATFMVLAGGVAATSTALVRESRQRTAAEQSAQQAKASDAATSRALAQVSAEAGGALEQRGRWDEAIARYREALAAGHLDRLGLRLRIVRCLTNSLKRHEAAAELAAVDRDFPGSAGARPELLFAKGDALSVNDPARSRALLEEALSVGLAGPDADYARGLLVEDVPAAREWFEKAVEKDPFHHDANAMLALMLLLEGRLNDATSRLDLWQQFFPESPTPVLLRVLHAILSRDDAAVAQRLREAKGHVLPEDLAMLSRFADLARAARHGGSEPLEHATVLFDAAALAREATASNRAVGSAGLADFRKPRCLDRLPAISDVLLRLSSGQKGSIELLDALAKAVPAFQGAALTNDVTGVDSEKLRRADPETVHTLERAIAMPEILVEHHASARLLLLGIHALAASTSPNAPDAASHRAAVAQITRDQLAAGGFGDLGGNWPNLATMMVVSRDWELTLQVAALADTHFGPGAVAAMARARAEYELGNYGGAILALDAARRLDANASADARDALRRNAVERLGLLGPPTAAISLAEHNGLDASNFSDKRPATRQALQPASGPSR